MDSESVRQARQRDWIRRLAWLLIPLLLAAIAVLWAANLRVVWPLPSLIWLVHFSPVALGVAFIVIPAARSFLAHGQPSVLMLGCGILMMDLGVTAMPSAFARSSNTAFAIYNTSALLGALCHFTGVIMTARGEIRFRRPALGLTAAYTGCLAAMGLVIWGAFAGWMPVFFVDGDGGTLLRSLVVGTAVALFLLTAGLLLQANRRAPSAFLYWYALGLFLLAGGLTGSMLIAVRDSPLQWVTRSTQVLGTVYMCVAVLAAARQSRAEGIQLAAVREAWRDQAFLARLRQQTPAGWVLRYGLAVSLVVAGLGLRQTLTVWVGDGLPTYVTFYPAVMAAALLAGMGPGLVATALTGFVASYWILPPEGFAIKEPGERLGLVVFSGMGLCISVFAELYRRNRDKAAAYDREAALRESRARLATFAEATFEGIVESEAGRIVDCNEQFARIAGYSVAELRGVEIARLIVPEDRERVLANIRQGQESLNEHAMLRKDGTRVIVEAHGRPAFAGSPRRHTAIRDITARKRAEEALRQSEVRYRVLFDTLIEGFCVIDVLFDANNCPVDYRFLEVNRAFEAQTGLQNAQGKRMRELAPEHEAHWFEIYGKVALTGEPARFVNEATALQRWFDVRAYRVGGADSRRVAILFNDITDAKRAEAALQREHALLQAVMDGAKKSHLVYLDRDFNFVRVNETYAATCGYRPEEMVGKNHFALYPHAENEAIFTRVRDTGKAVEVHDKPFEFPDQPERGVTYWDWTLLPVKDRVGDVAGLVFALYETTERKEAEEALRCAKDEWEETFNTVPDLVAILDKQHRIVRANRRMAEHLGRSPEECVGLPCHALVHGLDAPPAFCPHVQTCRDGHEHVAEVHEPRLGGDFLISTTPRLDERGRVIGAVHVARDITARKRMERALAESEERFRSIFNDVTVGIYRTTPDGQILAANPAMLRMLGYATPEDLSQRNLETGGFEPAYPRARFKEVLERDGEVRGFEAVWHTRDGRPIYVRENARAVNDERGQIVYYEGTAEDITDRKRAEQAIQESEQRLTLALDAADLAPWETDLVNGTIVSSARMARIYGVDPAHLPRTRDEWRAFVLEEDQAVLQNAIDSAAHAEGKFRAEFRIRRGDGVVRWVRSEGQLHMDEHGRPCRMAGVMADTTERKQAEDALRETLIARQAAETQKLIGAYNRSLIEASLDPLVTIDADGKITDVNAATEKVTGRTRQALVGTDFSDYFTAPEQARAGYQQVFRDGWVQDYALEVRHRDGHLTPVLYNASVYRDASGTVRGVFAAARDITDRKRAEAAVRVERQRLKDLVELLPAYVMLLSPDHRVPLANRFFRERFGESHGRRCYEYQFGRNEPCEICESFTVLRTNAPHHWEWTGPDGRNYDIFDYPFTDTDGSPLIMEMGIDITERKRLEAELRQANDELEQRVAVRTAELTASNTELEAFAYSVSHDLRAPLRSIDGFSLALLEDCADRLNSEGKGHLQRIRAASQRMAELIDGMLSLSRTTRSEMHPTVVDLTVLSKAIAGELQRTAPAREVEFVIAPRLAVSADANLLRIVLENLLGNAWKFTSKHPRARIEIGSLRRGNETVYFVRDDGAGFDMNYASKLFGAFQRLHPLAEFEGTGVGLATVQRIIHRHCGRVWAEGRVEQGATFYFTIATNPRPT